MRKLDRFGDFLEPIVEFTLAAFVAIVVFLFWLVLLVGPVYLVAHLIRQGVPWCG